MRSAPAAGNRQPAKSRVERAQRGGAFEQGAHRRARERVPVKDVPRLAGAHVPERRSERLGGVGRVESEAAFAARGGRLGSLPERRGRSPRRGSGRIDREALAHRRAAAGNSRRMRRAHARASESDMRRSAQGGLDTQTPTTRVFSPSAAKPAASPAAVPPEPSATTQTSGSGSSPSRTWAASSRAACTYPIEPETLEPPTVIGHAPEATRARERERHRRPRVHGKRSQALAPTSARKHLEHVVGRRLRDEHGLDLEAGAPRRSRSWPARGGSRRRPP